MVIQLESDKSNQSDSGAWALTRGLVLSLTAMGTHCANTMNDPDIRLT